LTVNFKLVFFLFSTATTLILVAGFIMFAMIGEINRRVAEVERMSYLFGYPSKHRTILRKYRDLYPLGRLGLYYWISCIAGFCFLFASAWEFGMFR